MIAWVIDNDVLFKGACYGLLGPLIVAVGPSETAGVLGQAKFVLAKKFRKKLDEEQANAALKRLNDSLTTLQVIEPSEEEIALAADLEFEATQRRVEFDSGESMLAAVVSLRRLDFLYTGDKRAIRALQEIIRGGMNGTAALERRVICLEQGIRLVMHRAIKTVDQVRSAICKSRRVDISLSICFSCSSPELPSSDEGLASYIEDIRRGAPNALQDG